MTARPRLHEHLAHLFPGYRITAIEPLAPDTGATAGSTAKAAGYGLPIRITLTGEGREDVHVVWRVGSANEFGHDRRADRAGNTILAFDDFARMPDHVRAIDLGVVRGDGELISVREADELYLITTYANGSIYADDLRRIVREQHVTERDLARVDVLARYLAKVHIQIDDPARYRRAIRDLVGHGEGIFGIIDGYPVDDAAVAERLRAIESRCVEWRWTLREHATRLSRTHGDFHPFNIVFDDLKLTALDASRGTCGDPADDVTALAINYVVFAVDTPAAWPALGQLWHRFWGEYERARPDPALCDVVPPFLAWRALVVTNPRFYPDRSMRSRDRLLRLAERALEAKRFDPAWADELFP